MNFKNSKPAPAQSKPVKPELQKTITDRRYYLLILILSFILYGNTINNRYAIDDFYVTGNNPLVQQGIKAIPAIFGSYYISINAEEGGQHNFGYRPVAKTTFAVERSLFGENPHISHLINILLYGLTGVILFRILRRLLKKYHLLLPLLTVIIFMAHPIHTEVTASLKNREEILSFLFALLSLHFIIKYHDSGRKLNIVWGSLAFGVSFLSKANTMTFLAVIPLVLYFFTTIQPKKIFLITLTMVVVLAAALFIPRLFLGEASRPMQFIENPLLFDVPVAERLGTALLSLLFYLKMMVIPHPLVYYYGYNMIPVTGFDDPFVWLSLILHIGLLGIAMYTIRKKHLLSFAILFYLINISPYSNLVSPLTGLVAERSLYIAVLGFCLALVYGLFRLSGSEPDNPKISRKTLNYVILASVVLSIPAAAKTIDRNADWKDELTLYAADAPHQEQSAKANFIYATNLRSSVVDRLKAGVPRSRVTDDANICITHFKRAVKVYPAYADAWNNLGEVYLLVLNEPDSAIGYFEKAVEANPEFTAAFYNLGYTYQITDQPGKAIPMYEKALELEPYEIRAMSNLAQLYHKTGQDDKAIRLNEDIIVIEPGLDIPYINLGTYAMKRGDAALALEYFEKAVEINPDNFELNMKLRSYFQKVGDSARADHYLDLARRSGKPQ